ncbi:hypothetical protein NDU88_002907 [Pleurodeles waltl]|uniref:Uncharacterized protein n=1 Tax=Pleurodeles waltl TaxID=8319 RepID=A0AAV7TLW6_PLEWA|nr:hypothetical protein NDU88_002907 [Pleurodeles waltl]
MSTARAAAVPELPSTCSMNLPQKQQEYPGTSGHRVEWAAQRAVFTGRLSAMAPRTEVGRRIPVSYQEPSLQPAEGCIAALHAEWRSSTANAGGESTGRV